MFQDIITYAKKQNLQPIKHRRKGIIQAYINLSDDGEYQNILVVDKKNQTNKLLPDFGSKTQGNYANALVEKVSIILDYNTSDDKKSDKQGKKHQSYVEQIQSGADECDCLWSVCQFLTRFETDMDFKKEVLDDVRLCKLKDDVLLSFCVDDVCIEDCENDWGQWFDQMLVSMGIVDDTEDEHLIISSVSGELQPCVSGQNNASIKKVDGIIKKRFNVGTGCPVVSAGHDAFVSYGYQGASGSQLGKEDAELFVTGVEYLMSSKTNHNLDFQLLYFYDGDVEDVIEASLANVSEREAEEKINDHYTVLNRILDGIVHGEDVQVPDEFSKIHYYMWNFSCPSDKRFYLSNEKVGTVQSLYENLKAWYQDTNVFDGRNYQSFREIWKIWNALGLDAKKYDNDTLEKLKRKMRRDVLDMIYQNLGVSIDVYKMILSQVPLLFFAKDMSPEWTWKCLTTSVQILKGYLVRKGYSIMSTVSQNINTAYACGKLFATYEYLQDCYNHGVKLNKNLAQTYFKGFMKQPKLMFPKVSELAMVYLHDIDATTQQLMFVLLGEIQQEIGMVIPDKFDVEEQGSFVLGYYQQKADFIKDGRLK